MHWFLFAVFAGILLLGAPSRSKAYQDSLTKDAISLATDGITQQETPRALHILIMKTFELCPSDFQVDASAYWTKAQILIGVGLILSLCLSFPPPPVSLGLGRSKSSVKRWKAWSKLVVITVPSTVVMGLLIPSIVSKIVALFMN